jgi:hypothetical protein
MRKRLLILVVGILTIGCGGGGGSEPVVPFVGQSRIESGTFVETDLTYVDSGYGVEWSNGVLKFSLGASYSFLSSSTYLHVPAAKGQTSGTAPLPPVDSTVSPPEFASYTSASTSYSTHFGPSTSILTQYQGGTLKWTYHTPGYVEFEISNAVKRTATTTSATTVEYEDIPLFRSYSVLQVAPATNYYDEATITVDASAKDSPLKVGIYDLTIQSQENYSSPKNYGILHLKPRAAAANDVTAAYLTYTVDCKPDSTRREYTAEAGKEQGFVELTLRIGSAEYFCTRGKVIFETLMSRKLEGVRFINKNNTQDFIEVSGQVLLGTKHIKINPPPTVTGP